MRTFLLFVLALFFTGTASAQIIRESGVNLSLSGRLNTAKGVTINSESLVDLNSVAGNLVHIAGSTTITSFGTASQAGIMRNVVFDGVLALTYDASTLVIPGSTTLTTAAGDTALIVADTTTKWVVHQYTRKSVAP